MYHWVCSPLGLTCSGLYDLYWVGSWIELYLCSKHGILLPNMHLYSLPQTFPQKTWNLKLPEFWFLAFLDINEWLFFVSHWCKNQFRNLYFLSLIMIQKLVNAKWSNGLQVLHLPFPYGNPACLWLNTIFHGLFLQ